MQLRPIHVAAAAAAAWALASTAALLRAGPLNPPAGPVTPTYKTLTEVEPRIPIGDATTPGTATALYRISQPGSYYLTGNITGVSGKRGIEIAASGVSIDLRGHSLLGVPGATIGIVGVVALERVSIRDGTLSAWPQHGVDMQNVAGRGITLDRVQSIGNGSLGFRLNPATTLTACIAGNNGGGGFYLTSGCVAVACTAESNGTTGSGAAGFFGSFITLTGCSAIGNDGPGYNCSGVFSGCTAVSNGQDGFQLGEATVTGCTARSNGATGISAFRAVITGCNASGNTGDGISAVALSLVRGNTCYLNGAGAGSGAGVHVTQTDNRVEGNNCCQNDRGIDADAGGNFIIANSCSGNTDPVSGDAPNYAITGTQTIGPIITATGTIATTNPWANFSY